MTTSASTELYTQHAGLSRIQGGARSLRQIVARLGGARGASSLLLAATVAALMVAANALIDDWSKGHLLAAWLVLWGVAFAGMALLAAPTRKVVALLRSGAQARPDAPQRHADNGRIWNPALYDACIMTDLSRAMNGIAVDDIRRYR